jgi:ADP-ribose pyrophosphatase
MKVKINQTQLEYNGFIKVEKAELEFEKFNGAMSAEITRFRHSRGDAVAVLIYDETTNQVLLIKQFRYAVYANNGDGWLVECVAGMMEENETPLEVAQREVFEETGFKLESAELLADYFFSPGGCSDKVHLFLGKVEDPTLPLDIRGLALEGEEIQAQWVPLQEALQMIEDRKIMDGKTLIGLMLLERRLNERRQEGGTQG